MHKQPIHRPVKEGWVISRFLEDDLGKLGWAYDRGPAGPNGYGHLQRAVKGAVRAHRSMFRCVSDKPRSPVVARMDGQ